MMAKLKKIVKYIFNRLIPAFGIVCVLGAGNTFTLVVGLLILIVDLLTFEDK